MPTIHLLVEGSQSKSIGYCLQQNYVSLLASISMYSNLHHLFDPMQGLTSALALTQYLG